MSRTSRRDFLAAGLLGAGVISVGLFAWARRRAGAHGADIPESMGRLRVAADETTGLPLLLLPEAFRYRTLSWAGAALHDGHAVPGAADGMGVVRQQGSRVTLVRNHELQGSSGAMGDPALAYDNTPGGTTTLVFDTASETLADSWVSLGGTLYNCAGGVTPWGTWLSCEEATLSPALLHLPTPKKHAWWDVDRARREHGYVFEVPAEGVAKPEPILAMGQFYHEAVAFDPDTGIAYMTEDNGPNAGFYRFLPDQPGRLQAGGRLQMMKVDLRPDMSDYLILGQEMDVGWVDIPEPTQGFTAGNRNGDGVVSQGLAAGGSRFIALEGCTYSEGKVYFTSKLGGRAISGYVLAYEPAREKIWMVYESPGHDQFSGPDNLVVSPRGSLVICEDRLTTAKAGQMVCGLTQKGEFFRFCQVNPALAGEYAGHDLAVTALTSEWAGATFSQDGEWLFLNLYSPGVTVAITGPWQDGYI
ncbi:MAG: PhoX family protein [Xanthomonadales bacterium]|nr:PhoX family protein [Xanthomonadales bacterium]